MAFCSKRLVPSGIFQVKAMNYATCAAGKVASTVKDHVVTL
jgi:hypothetical protein